MENDPSDQAANVSDGAPDGDEKPAPVSKAAQNAQPSRRQLTAVALAGGFVGLCVALYVFTQLYGSGLVVVNEENFAAARKKWDASALESYRLKVKVAHRETVFYEIVVVEGKVTDFRIDGKPLKRLHASRAWTVPGMFDTLRMDLDQIARFENGEREAKISLNAKFDEDWGYPSHMVRIESRRAGGNPEVSWEVTEFEVTS